jgi:hypothetical protein
MRQLALCLCLLPLPAIAKDATVHPRQHAGRPARRMAWTRAAHRLQGALGARPVNNQILDLSVAQGIATFQSKREYLPGGAGRR